MAVPDVQIPGARGYPMVGLGTFTRFESRVSELNVTKWIKIIMLIVIFDGMDADSSIGPASLVGYSAALERKVPGSIPGSAHLFSCLLQNVAPWDWPHELLVVWAGMRKNRGVSFGFQGLKPL